MCAVCSALNKHDKALNYAKLAIGSIYEELLALKQSRKEDKLKDKYTIISMA